MSQPKHPSGTPPPGIYDCPWCDARAPASDSAFWDRHKLECAGAQEWFKGPALATWLPDIARDIRESNASDLAESKRRRRRLRIVLYIILAAAAGWIVGEWMTGRANGQTIASVVAMKCNGATGPASDCVGLYLVDLVAADGTALKIIGAPPAPGVMIDPTQWTRVQLAPVGPNSADEETPGGIPDGTLQFFTLRQVPIVATVKLYRNGQRLYRGGDYAVYPSTKRLGFYPCCIPKAGDKLRVDYQYTN